MNGLRAAIGAAVVVLLLVNTAATGAYAQQGPRRLPFDASVSALATVHTEGQVFVVYECRNLLPYAGGISVVSNGTPVTSAETADEVFEALARRRATKFQPENRTISELQRLVRRSRTLQTATGEAVDALNGTLAYRERLTERTVNGTSAWERAMDASDALDQRFGSGAVGASDARDLRERLEALHSTAAALEADATRVVTLLERRRGGSEINQSDLYRRYRAVHAELEELRAGIEAVRGPLSTVADASRTGASEAGSVPVVGDGIERRFGAAAETLESTGGTLAGTGPAIASVSDALPPVGANERYQRRLTDRWHARRGAPAKLYATAAEAGIFLAAGAIVLFSRRPW